MEPITQQQPQQLLQQGGGGSSGVAAAAPPAAATAGPAGVGVAFGVEPVAVELPPPPPPPPQVVVDGPPGMPQLMDTSTTAISLQWTPVRCTVHSGAVPVAVEYIVNYQLQMQQVDEKVELQEHLWSVQYVGTASFVQVKGLQPGRKYAARVMAVPYITNMMEVVVVPSPPCQTVVVETLPCPPMGQPEPQLASRLKKELKFKWAEPEETGGRPLEYMFQMTPTPEGYQGAPTPDGWYDMYRGTERSYLAKRLLPGVQYYGRVKAINCEGESAWSPASSFCTQATVPSWSPSDAPFVYDTSASSVTLGWPEPASNGGVVTGYELEMDDGSGFRHVARSADRTCVVQGLRSGVLYKFRVRAENEAGRSLWSPLGEGRTAAVPPGACRPPTVLGSSQTSLSLRWEGPEDDGGSPVNYYQVELRPKCAAARRALADEWLIAYRGPDPACTIDSLKPGCSYMLRVCAVSQPGFGAFSSVAILQTAPNTPECPGAPTAVARQQTELTVAWPPPEHDGGSRITAYRLEMSCLGGTEGSRGDGGKGKGKLDPPFEKVYLGPDRSTVVAGLEPGQRYAFRCSAINDQGSSGYGPVAQLETLPGLPFPVDSIELVALASTSIKLRWNPPFGRGAPVSSYVVEMARTAALPQQQQQQQPGAGGLSSDGEGEELEQQLAAASGQQQEQAQQQQQQQPAEQQQANGHVAEGSNGKAEADAEAGPAVDVDALFQAACQGPDSSCTVSGLEPHTEYTFRVRATNAVGSSVSELETFRTAPAAPSCPRSTQQEGSTPTTLQISWQYPQYDHGAAVAAFQLEVARGMRASSTTAWRMAYQGAATHAQVEGLDAGSRYLVRTRAGNACGWGPWSEPLQCSTDPDVPAAPSLAAKAVGTTVRANWEAPEDNGAAILGYELEMAPAGSLSFAAVFSGEGTTHRVQQLEANSGYQFRVRAVNAVGAGPYSPVVAVQTSKAPPSPPENVQAEAAPGGGSIRVSWEPAQQGAQQAACISYEVEASGPSLVRQPCPARSTETVLSGLQAGSYQVRLRGVGADGAGHGSWSTAARVKLEGLPADAAAAGSAGAGGQEGSKPQKRRERSGGSGGGGGGQPQQRGAVLVTKTVAAKGAPRKVTVLQQVRRLLARGISHLDLWTILYGVGLFAVLIALLLIFSRFL